MHPIQEILNKRKEGIFTGIYSCCSANEYVLRAVFSKAMKYNIPALIECTANQVDQFGGYTGMRPSGFYEYVLSIARKEGLDTGKIILGGDHLGPLTWAHLPEKEAMEHAKELVYEYVLAGFTKIHIDTSMRLADDDSNARLSDEIIAERSSELCLVAENAYKERVKKIPDSVKPVYVIGSEVPIPGGEQEIVNEISVTKPEEFHNTMKVFRDKYAEKGLNDAWSRVIGVVVQPGVEFGDSSVHIYNRQKSKAITDALKDYPNLVFEGHSTDYQTAESLKEMVEDGIAILKVGPALTYALREALISLENIEKELLRGKGIWLSDFRATLETAMLENPKNWLRHYHGDGVQQRLARIFSFSDRARYYLPDPRVSNAVERLLSNLSKVQIPNTLISQYMPLQYNRIRQKKLSTEPEALLIDRIGDYIDDYLYACFGIKKQEN